MLRCSLNPKTNPWSFFLFALSIWTSYQYGFSFFSHTHNRYCQQNWYLYICPKVPSNEQYQRNNHFILQFHKKVIRNNFGEQMLHMFAELIQIEKLQTIVARIMKKNIVTGMISALEMVSPRWQLCFVVDFIVYFSICISKDLQKLSAIQNNFTTLLSEII